MWIPVGRHLGLSAFPSDESHDYNTRIRQLELGHLYKTRNKGTGGYFRSVGGLPGFSPRAWGAVTQGSHWLRYNFRQSQNLQSLNVTYQNVREPSRDVT